MFNGPRRINFFYTLYSKPFERFESNAAYYYTMVLAFNLYECFKEDITKDIIPKVCYATTFRRRLIDIAGKIVETGHRIKLKVTKSIYELLNLEEIWRLVNAVPVPLLL